MHPLRIIFPKFTHSCNYLDSGGDQERWKVDGEAQKMVADLIKSEMFKNQGSCNNPGRPAAREIVPQQVDLAGLKSGGLAPNS